MTRIDNIYFLLIICVIFTSGTGLITLDWFHITVSNYPKIHDCGCIRYQNHDSPNSLTCIPLSLVDQFCRVPNVQKVLQNLNKIMNTSEKTIIERLEVEIDIDEYKNTVILDGKSIHPSFNISKALVHDHLYVGKSYTFLCPPKGNGETNGVISFVDWKIKTDVQFGNIRGCRNENESIITIQNSSDIRLEHMIFEDNEQPPILIIDSNVTILNCTLRGNKQYYNKEHKQTGLTRDVMRGFSLGVTIIMTKYSTNNHVGIRDSEFINNRCLKANLTSKICVHKVSKNSIPTSYFAGAIGVVIVSDTGYIDIGNTKFINNTACDSGGGVFIQVFEGMTQGEFSIWNSRFISNTAGYLGGGLHIMQEVGAHNFELSLYNDTFESNQGCIAGGGFAMLITDTTHKFDLIKNYTMQTKEPISFAIAISTTFKWNYSGRLSSGHAGYLKAYGSPAKRQHPVIIFIECEFDSNYKINSNPNGFTFGSIMAENFILVFWGNNSIMNSNSGGILQIQSIIIVNGSLTFQNLSAYTGGAIHARKWSKLMLTDDSTLLFKNNNACIAGGAIFHYYGNWNGYSGANIYNSYCLLGYFPSIREEPNLWKARVRFEGNDAGEAGGAVFMTDLRQCALIDGKIDLRKAFNYTDNFTFVNNTVAQGRYKYLANYNTYGDIASPVVKLQKLPSSDSIDRGPGIERPLALKPLDQLNQSTIAVLTIKPMSQDVELEHEHKVITQKEINDYNKCKSSGNNMTYCLGKMPYIRYSVKDFSETSIKFKYTIESGVESINIDDDYFENDYFTIHDPYCDVGYILKDGKCVCDAGNNGIVRCSSDGEVYIKPGFWGIKKQGPDSNYRLTGTIAQCAHSTCTCNNYTSNCPITDNPNDFCVKQLHVEGDLCGTCQQNYTSLPFSIECVEAPERNMDELMAAYVLLTFICSCLIILFRCKLWNGFRIIIIILYALTYINYSFNFNQHVHTLRAIQVLQGLSILNFYTIFPAYRSLNFSQVELICLYPVFTILVVLAIFAVLSAVSYRFPASTFHHKFKMRRLMSPGLLLWYLMSISLFRVFLDYAYCITVVNNSTESESKVFRNRYDGAIECYTFQNDYIYYLLAVIFATSILILPLPAVLVVGALKRNTTRSYSLNKLVIPYTAAGRFHWAWEFTRIICLATGLAIHDLVPQIGNSLLMTIIVFFMIVHIHFWPYKEWTSNIIECIGWILLSLVFIINHKVVMESALDIFQLILIILIFILVGCTFIVYVFWKVFSKLKKDKIQTRLKKFLNKHADILMVKFLLNLLDKKFNESKEEVTTEEVRDVERPKRGGNESLHRRDSILANLSINPVY